MQCKRRSNCFYEEGQNTSLPFLISDGVADAVGDAVDAGDGGAWARRRCGGLTSGDGGGVGAGDARSGDGLILGYRQCEVLVQQLRKSAAKVSSKGQGFVFGQNKVMKEYYRVVMDVILLLSCCHQKPWVDSAVMLLNTSEDFTSVH